MKGGIKSCLGVRSDLIITGVWTTILSAPSAVAHSFFRLYCKSSDLIDAAVTDYLRFTDDERKALINFQRDGRSFMRSFTYSFLLTLLLCSSASLFAFAKFNYPLTGIDDANIYFVYARNLANGHGFVYNVGGERVEGFTSLLWTLIVALAFKGSARPELVLLFINIVLLSLGNAVALHYLQNDFLGMDRTRQNSLIYSIIFVTLIFTCPRYIVWNTITLMENGLWSTLLLITTIFVIKNHSSPREINLGFIFLSILLLLTRPESILWTMVFALVLFIRVAVMKNLTNALKELAPAFVCPLIFLVALTLFRIQYFGYPFPNTYYAKVSPSFTYNLGQGAIYLAKYMISDPIVLLSVTAIGISGLNTIFRVFSRQVPAEGSFFLPILAGTGLLAPLITGGDHFGSFRVYQNIYPIEVLCLLYFVSQLLPRFLGKITQSNFSPQNRKIFILTSTFALILVFFSFQLDMWKTINSEIDVEFRAADYGRKSGAYMQRLFTPLPKLPSLGVVTSGGIKYSYEGQIVDLMGLNNTLMAHNQGDRKGIKDHAAFDIQTFYKLQPDIVWPVTVVEQNWQYRASEIKESWENTEGFKGLFDEARFLELYSYAKVTGKASNTYALIAWFKKDLLQQLRINPEFHVVEYTYSP